MNARQKAKKYKKMAESYKDKAEAYDRYMRIRAFERESYKQSYGTIETVKVVKFWDDRFPQEIVKRDIANALADFCLENKFVNIEVGDDYDEFTRARRIIGTLRVAKKWGDTE